MSQSPITAYFTTRKRQATEDLRSKTKDSLSSSPKILRIQGAVDAEDSTIKAVVRNIQFNLPKDCTQKASKIVPRSRTTHAHKLNANVPNSQTDIRESLLKINNTMENKKIQFEKISLLSSKKECSTTLEKQTFNIREEKEKEQEQEQEPEPSAVVIEQSTVGCTTPKKSANDRCTGRNADLNQIKNKINRSSRLAKLKASIGRFMKLDQRLSDIQRQNDSKISSEHDISYKSEETTSPIIHRQNKTPAYQRYQALIETTPLPLPYSYKFLAEAFRSIDKVSSILYNRKEIISFRKLQPAVQELLQHDFTLEHLAQIKTIYPDAYIFHQEKCRTFDSLSKEDKYDLVLMPNIQSKSSSNLDDMNDVLNETLESKIGPVVLLERKKKFYNILLEKVKDEHEKFLLNLDVPMVVPKEKIMRWHPEFNVDSCKHIQPSDLPQPSDIEKANSAKDVLEKVKSFINCNMCMKKSLERLAKGKMTSKFVLPEASHKSTDIDKSCKEQVKKVNITIVDTPPATPTTKKNYLKTIFKGLPKVVLKKVREKQAAKGTNTKCR